MSITWCKKQGLKLIEPNEDLAKEYYQSAEETLRVLNLTKKANSNMWLATQKYYAEYLLAYALLMKLGIKTDIHSCTIDIIKLLEEQKIILFNFSKILEEDKELRIENQYYLKNKPVIINSEKLTTLFLELKKITENLDKKDIQKIREKITTY